MAYIAYYTLHSIFWCLGVAFVFYAATNLISFWQVGHSSNVSFGFLFLGGLLGRSIKLYFLVGGLYEPEKYTAWLEKVVSDKLPG